MKTLVNNLLMATFIAFFCNALTSHAQELKGLSPAQQQTFLSKRTSLSIMGTFDGYCSYLYAVKSVAIHTESEEINRTRLHSTFPDFYKPTWRELFDTIARQTKSSWNYDPSRDFWVFAVPPQPLPFEIAIAKGWKAHDEGLFVGYQPSIAPVGMDVYMLGRYSATNEAGKAALFKQIREAIAIRFASGFKKDVTAQDMKEVAAGNLQALHFQGAGPTGIIWRQWVIFDSGMAFAIVSAIKPENEKVLLPDVLKMLGSFRVKEPASATPAPPHPSAPTAH